MGLKIEGMDELITKLDRLGQDGAKIGNKGLKAGAKVILEYQREYAPTDSERGKKALKATSVKTSAIKNKYIQIGILKSAPWESIRGIYFQNYGYKNKRTGRYHAPTLWVDKAFAAARSKAQAALKDSVQRELKL